LLLEKFEDFGVNHKAPSPIPVKSKTAHGMEGLCVQVIASKLEKHNILKYKHANKNNQKLIYALKPNTVHKINRASGYKQQHNPHTPHAPSNFGAMQTQEKHNKES